MPYLPYYYDKLNKLDNSYYPNTVKMRNNASFIYWQRSLFQRACSTIEFELPEEWNGSIKDFFYYCLFRFGFVCVFKDPEFGLIFQPCTLKGYNLYYQPTECLIQNAAFNSKQNNREYIIGENCQLIKLTPDFKGVWDIIDFYATKLALLNGAIDMSLVNSKYAFILTAKTKACAEAIKAGFDRINNGQPMIIFDQKLVGDDAQTKSTPFQTWERDVKKNYLTSDQLRDHSVILSNFDSEVGIVSLPYEKKERLVTSEAEIRTQDSVSRSVIWYDTLNSSLKLVNDMFDTNITAKLRYNNFNETKNEEGEE